jgi:hypothetical protein
VPTVCEVLNTNGRPLTLVLWSAVKSVAVFSSPESVNSCSRRRYTVLVGNSSASHLFPLEHFPQAFVADVFDHPLGDQEISQLDQAPGREGQPMVHGPRQGYLFYLLALREGEGERPAT